MRALVPAPTSAKGRTNDLAAHPGSLAQVPRAYRPEFRWWWPTNTLRFEVATSLNNALVTQGSTGDPEYASYATRPLQRSGLIGPVRLVPYAEAVTPR